MRKVLAFLVFVVIVFILITFFGEVQIAGEPFEQTIVEFLTHPVVITVLLVTASLGLVLELFSPGFGVSGSFGLIALLLFFYGHLAAGLTGYDTIFLFILGIGFILLELFLPGGILGILGIISIIASLLLAAENIIYMGISVLIAISAAILGSIMMIRMFGKSMRIFNKIILTDSTNTESGYVSNRNRTELLGKPGITYTDLRPSGTVIIDEERIDVVSEGNFIGKGKQVKVVKVEGARIVVREFEGGS